MERLEEACINATNVHKFYKKLREGIYEEATKDEMLGGEVEIDESHFGGKRKGKRGRGALNKIPVFGILEQGGKVKVEVVKDVKAVYRSPEKLESKIVERGGEKYG